MVYACIKKGEIPRLIDEWQVAPILWDSVRHEVDMRGEERQFILTGSATPILDDQISHTGTGRITRIKMRPMSLFESDESTGEISLKALFAQDNNVSAIQSKKETPNGEIHIRLGEFTVELHNGYDPQRVFGVLQMLKTL